MTHESFDDLAVLRSIDLPAAPAALRDRIRMIPTASPIQVEIQPGRKRPGTWLLAAALVTTGAVGGALLLTGGGAPDRAPNPSTVAAVDDSRGPLDSASPLLETVDGLPVMTVSETLAARAKGTIHGPVAVRGYWSFASHRIGCRVGSLPNPSPRPVLLSSCSDHLIGMTERNEWIATVDAFGRPTYGVGPWLTPYLDARIAGGDRLLDPSAAGAPESPPVPIVVIGHFGDARAIECSVAQRQACDDRFVLDRVVTFDVAGGVLPAPTPSPTPFPFADPPPPPITVEECTHYNPHHVEFEVDSAGWRRPRSLGLDIGFPDEIAYVIVLKSAPAGFLAEDPDRHMKFRIWNQRVCLAWLEVPGMFGTTLPGSTVKHYTDGSAEPTSDP